MSVTIPQTSYAMRPSIALAGMQGDVDNGQLVIGKFTAAETLLPGRVVELDPTDPTKCRYPKTASAVGSILGVVLYSAADPVGGTVGTADGGFKAGDTVRILRRGQVWCEYTGTAGSDMMTAMKVRSASDDSNSEAQHRGKLTDASTSTTVGQEKYATKLLCMEETVSGTGLVLVELNGALT